MLLPKIKKIPKNTNGRLAVPALAGLLVCFVTTMKLLAYIADLFNSFCKEVYAVAFFKVVQRQAVGEVGNSITYLLAGNFCLQQ